MTEELLTKGSAALPLSVDSPPVSVVVSPGVDAQRLPDSAAAAAAAAAVVVVVLSLIHI